MAGRGEIGMWKEKIMVEGGGVGYFGNNGGV